MPDVAAPIIPFLRYQDPGKALTWLCEAFGFQPLEVTNDPDGTVVHAELRWRSGSFQIGATDFGVLNMGSPRELPFTSQGVYVYIDDEVDAHFATATAAGAEVVIPPTDMDYGSREYVVRDLEGHVWGFGNYAPKMD